MQELVPSMICVKSGQVGRLLIEVDAPESILSINLTEACITVEPMRDLLKGWGLVVLLNHGLVQIPRIEADM